MLATSRRRNDYERENTIGRMDRKIYILAPVISDGVSNEDKIDAYEVVDNVWARADNDLGETVVEQNQVKHVHKTTFTIRYRTDLTIKNRIVLDNKMYTVLSSVPLNETRKRRTIVITEYLQDYVIT
jgi:SPP1 family predicted phage head-tail adaptor